MALVELLWHVHLGTRNTMNDQPSLDSFRWQSFFQHSAQPVFLLNRRRRLLFANRAWEACTGLTLAEVRGRVCRRRSSVEDREEAVLGACAPPADALAGRACQVRRRLPGPSGWWEIQYQPLLSESGLLGILGVVRVLSAPGAAPPPLPDKLMALRDRSAARYRLDEPPEGSANARLFEQASLAAQTHSPIAIVGEPGVGKEWLARVIHGRGDGRQRFFARLDADRLPGPIVGDMILGHPNRAMNMGTIYLHDPAALSLEWQGRIAEFASLRNQPEAPRLIVGFRNDPGADVQAKRLLEDLYYAVSSLTISIPPLRERLAELPYLVDVFLDRARMLTGRTTKSISSEAMNVMRGYVWPNNLRELQDVILDACRRAKGERIELAELPFHLKNGPLPVERRLPLDRLLEQVERRLIALTLKLTDGNQTRTAELLEVWRPRLLRRMKALGLESSDSSS